MENIKYRALTEKSETKSEFQYVIDLVKKTYQGQRRLIENVKNEV